MTKATKNDIVYDYRLLANLMLDRIEARPSKFIKCYRQAIPYLLRVKAGKIIIGHDKAGKPKTLTATDYIAIQPVLKDGAVDFHQSYPNLHALDGLYRGHEYDIHDIQSVQDVAQKTSARYTPLSFIEKVVSSIATLNKGNPLEKVEHVGWAASTSIVAPMRFGPSLNGHYIFEPWGGGMLEPINYRTHLLHVVVGHNPDGSRILDVFPNFTGNMDDEKNVGAMDLWRPIDGRIVTSTRTMIKDLTCVSARDLRPTRMSYVTLKEMGLAA